jgi:hypothetical protein
MVYEKVAYLVFAGVFLLLVAMGARGISTWGLYALIACIACWFVLQLVQYRIQRKR